MCFSYGFFLRSSNPTSAIAMIIAITPIAKYVARSAVVARFVIGALVVAGVVAGKSTAKAVSADVG